MSKPIVAIVTGNSNSGSSCIKELFEKYSDRVQVRGVFRSEEKAKPFRTNYPKLEVNIYWKHSQLSKTKQAILIISRYKYWSNLKQVVVDVDASKPETLKKAFEKAQYALIVTPHDPTQGFSNDANLTETMINHAVQNGVKYIVLVGSWTVKDKEKLGIISGRFVSSEKLLEKLGTEKGLKWTVLRGGFFMENLLAPHVKQAAKSDSAFRFPKVYVPMVDTRDIGKSAAACLAAQNIEQHNGKHYQMNGPEMLTGEDIARVLSKQLGKPIQYQETPKDMLRKFMPEAIAQIFDYMIENGKEAVPFTQDVKNLTGQNASFEQFIRDHKDFFN